MKSRITKKIIVFTTTLIFISCSQVKKEYYPNGNLYKEYTLKNDLYDGEYQEFYKDGTLRVIHHYQEGKRIDTSFYYDKEGRFAIRIHSDSLIDRVISFDENKTKMGEGNITKDGKKIGKWTYFKKDTTLVTENVIVDDSLYENQYWTIDKSGDTLWEESNDYLLFLDKKDLTVKDTLRIRVVLDHYYLNSLSDIKVLLFNGKDTLKHNFYNLKNVEIDTFPSLKNDGIPHPEVPDYVPQNHVVEFGLMFESPGADKIKGVLREYAKAYLKDNPDSIVTHKRDLFFEREIFVSDEE